MWTSPINGKNLTPSGDQWTDGENLFNVKPSGIIDLIFPKRLNQVDEKARSFYEGRADAYEKYLHLTFQTYGEDEDYIRNYMIDKLQLTPSSKVLEIACGTGRDTLLIADRLGKEAIGYFVDIAEDMLETTVHKLKHYDFQKYFSLANAMKIPLADNSVDCLYSFGAVGEFSDIKTFFKECVRVVKTGGRVVVGDENLPVWLRNSEFGKILSNYNNQFLAEVPFKDLPIEARNVKCEWVIGGVFYLIEFEVGEGEPFANFDFDIPGARGGTHRTRMYGQLEGIKLSTKELALKAQESSGLSMHEWLNQVVLEAAQKGNK